MLKLRLFAPLMLVSWQTMMSLVRYDRHCVLSFALYLHMAESKKG